MTIKWFSFIILLPKGLLRFARPVAKIWGDGGGGVDEPLRFRV